MIKNVVWVNDNMEVINDFEKLMQDTADTIIEKNTEDICTDEVEIIPTNANILIQPYDTNPYRYIEKTESGLIVGIESSKTYKSNETGEIELNKDVIRCGKVIAIGNSCKNVEIGDDVFFTTFSMTPIPFRKQGLIVVSETLIICRIVRK